MRARFLRTLVISAFGVAGVILPTSGVSAQIDAAAQCKALTLTDFSGIPDAATQITSTRFVDASEAAPAHCSVNGYIAPNIGIEMLLPAANWNGKFLKHGCGGFCGSTYTTACYGPVSKGYACIVSNMGHTSTGLDAKWAYNNLQAEIDFAYRATHVSAVAGKAITEQFYAKAPNLSYFMGCSTGGRQGMVEAQRFPYDFNGIIAGAPVIDETGDGWALLWIVNATLGKDGKSILSPDDLRMVNAAVVAKCDMNDGVQDGLIGDARQCDFDPADLQCTRGQRKDCLSKDHADAIRKIYTGPVDAAGSPTYTGGALPGSELNWINNYISEDGGPSTYNKFMSDMFRYMNFMPDPGPSWTLDQIDFNNDYKRLGLMESLYTGSNPDLRKFKSAGGKVMIYQGWADQSVLPLNAIDYYETATRTMGGREATEDFFRLFMVPGMNHCTGGVGAWAIDYLSAMERWVENGEAPDMLVSQHPDGDVGSPTRFPIDPAKVKFSRPVYPYPVTPVYDGTGDPDMISSYRPSN